MDVENSRFGELSSQLLNSTQLFAGPNDGLSQTYNGVSTFVGLEGHSQKAGYRVIFPTLDMGRYVEIAEADILETEKLSPAHSPFGALGGTRIAVREAARIVSSRAAAGAQEIDDEFDLDIRLGASASSMPTTWGPPEGVYAPGREGAGKQAMPIQTNGVCPKTEVTCAATCHTCKGEFTCATCQTHCEQDTCITCKTCKGEDTCQTCNTQCEQKTCQTCHGEATCETCQTCHTKCEQNTCQTCKGEGTCHTCETRCEQKTCVTCQTCADKGCPIHTQTCCGHTCF